MPSRRKRYSLRLGAVTIAIALLAELIAAQVVAGGELLYGPMVLDVSMLQDILIGCSNETSAPISSFTFALLNVGTGTVRIASIDITEPDLGAAPASRGFWIAGATRPLGLTALVGSTSVSPPAIIVRTVASNSPIEVYDNYANNYVAASFFAVVRLTERAPAGTMLLMAPEISVADIPYAVFAHVTERGATTIRGTPVSLERPLQIDVSRLQNVVICVDTAFELASRDGFTFALLNADASSAAISWVDSRMGDTPVVPSNRSYVVDTGQRMRVPLLAAAGLSVSPPGKLVHVVASGPSTGPRSRPEWIMVRFTEPAPEGAVLLVVPEHYLNGYYHGLML